MATDVSGMSREKKLAILSKEVHAARAERESQGQMPDPRQKIPVAQSAGSVTYQVNEPLSALTSRIVAATQRQAQRKKQNTMESRLDDALPSRSEDSIKQAADDAQRRLQNYTHSPAVQKRMRQQDEADTMANDAWDDPNQPQRDETLIRLQQEAKQAQADYDDAQRKEADQNIYDKDMADISALSEEEQRQLADYVSVRDQGATGNPITDLIYLPIRKKKAAGGLLEKFGEARLNELAETYARDLHKQTKQEVQAAAQENAQGVGKAALSTVGNIVASPIGSIMGVKGRLDEMGNSTGRYSTLETYTPGDAINVYGDAAKQAVTKQIEGENPNFFRQSAAILYQAGTGALESAAKAITLGPAAAASTSAMGQYTRTLSEASERGATAQQATLLASANAALDYAMDKIPLDRLFSLAKSGSTSAWKAALKQAGIEASTEGASFIGSLLLDMAILQQNSEYAQSIQNYMLQGLTQQEATAQANKDLLSQAGQQAIIGGISGGVSAGVSTAIGNARTRRAEKAANAAMQDATADKEEAFAPIQQPAPQQPEPTPHQPPAPEQPINPQQPIQQPEPTQTAPESPLDTVSRMVRESTAQRQQEQQAARQSIQDQVAAMTGTQEPAEQAAPTRPDTLGMQSEPSEDIRKSRSVTNSGLNSPDPDIQAGYRETLSQDPEAGDYVVKHNADTLTTAQQRTSTPERVRAEYDYLVNKTQDSWTAEDVATGRLVAKELFKSGDSEAVTALNKQLARVATNAGQVSQAFAITGTMRDAADPQAAAESATARLMNMKQGETTFTQKKGGPSFEQWQNDIANEYTRLGMAIDSVPEGDANAMRDVIRQIAQSRKTTAWFGISSKLTKNAERILKKLDYDTLKKIADTQLAAMPDDFRKRSSMEITLGLRKQGMLSSLKTFERNLAGNSATGLLDSFSDSIGGRFVDSLLSKKTGKRTVGNDIALPGKYLNAAKDSMDFAALCVELNVPVETDINASFNATGADSGGKYFGKTFRSNGNVAMRVLYAYQKYMSYALDVSDKVFEGGTNAAVTESLNRLKGSNLSDAEIQQLAEFTANRRTFKDATWEEGGKTYGSSLSRTAQSLKNIAKGKGGIVETAGDLAGDIVLPFPSVSTNVAQTGIDYTAGVGKGAAEIAAILKDVKAGKEINVARQRQAVSDFGRGMTGLTFIGIMTVAAANGIIQVHNDSDKNKKALDQSQGLSGAQINWSALSRAAEGGSEEWQSGDVVTSLDFLEPFNTQMYLAVELARDDSVKGFMESPTFGGLADVGKAYVKGSFPSVVNSFMDSPMMDGLNQLTELGSDLKTAADAGSAEDVANALADYGGDVASSFVPQFVRQTAQTMDGYYRDTRGETSLDYAKNNLMSAIPGASQELPKKIDGFGKEQQRGGFVANFLDPTNTHRLEINELSGYLEDLSGKTGDTGIYPERQAPLTVKNAVGDEVTLTGTQRETYQKTYGQWMRSYYSTMAKDKSFSALSDELKVKAMKQAKDIAASRARASVTDFKGPKSERNSVTVRGIVRDVTLSNINSYINGAKTDWANSYNASENLKGLDDAYSDFRKLPSATQQEVLSKATGDTEVYLSGRKSGLNGTVMTSIIRQVQALPEKDSNKRSAKLQTVASTKGLSESQLDTAMKLYMPDYDPTDKEPDKTEVKYDYIRKELGLSTKEYADTYAAYLYSDTDGDGKSQKDDKVQGIMDLGFDRATAEQLYYIYAGSGNAAKAAISKFIEENY